LCEFLGIVIDFPDTGSYCEPFKVHAVTYSVLGDRQ
jgi:hypothetical protein